MVSFIWAMRFLFLATRTRDHKRKSHLLTAKIFYFFETMGCHRNEKSKNSFESFVLLVAHTTKRNHFC